MADRLREFFGYVQRGELWDGAPAYWHRGRAYRRLESGRFIRGLTPETNREIAQVGVVWVAAERVGPGRYVRHPDSPEFPNVGSLMVWLEGRGLIRHTGGVCGEIKGWGDPWYAVHPEQVEQPILTVPLSLGQLTGLCPECGLPLPGPHRGTCSASLAMGGRGYGLPPARFKATPYTGRFELNQKVKIIYHDLTGFVAARFNEDGENILMVRVAHGVIRCNEKGLTDA